MSTVPAKAPGTPTGEIEEHVKAFREQGFVVVPALFSGAELQALQEEAIAQIEAGPDRQPANHFKRGKSADGAEVFFRIEAVAGKRLRNESALLAMAHPRLLELVGALVDDDFVCWSDALLWKGPQGGAAVDMHSGHGWHDDTVEHENLVVDIYLDQARPENGCLKVLPGSHRLSPEEHHELLAQGFDIPGLVDVKLEPGDVLFHSEWMIHGSQATGYLGRPTRRILYYAFRSPRAFLTSDSSEHKRRVVAACLRRMQLAQERRAVVHAGNGEAVQDISIPGTLVAEVAAVSAPEAMAIGHFEDVLVADSV